MAGDQPIETKRGNQGSDRIRKLDPVEPGGCGLQLRSEPGFAIGEGALNRSWILKEVALELHDPQPLVDIRWRDDVDAEPEPIEQLRPQLSFFGVHRAHQDEMRGMDDRDAFALDDV